MSRALSNAMIAEIAKDGVRLFHTVFFDFDTAIRLTTLGHDIVIDSNNYVSDSRLLSMSAIKESAKISIGSVTVTLSGVSGADTSIALTEDFMGKEMTIRLGVVTINGALILSPTVIFEGAITIFKSSGDYNSGTSKIAWTAASHWADFDKKTGRMTNEEDQSYHFPFDKGFEFAATVIENLKWGNG